MKRQQRQVSALQVPISNKTVSFKWKSFAPAFLFSCILLMTIATAGLVVNKSSQQQIAKVDRPSQPIIVQSDVDTSQFLTNNQAQSFLSTQDGEKMVSGVQERLDNLETKVEMWEHRNWLLSLAVNENANLAKRNHNAGYITFNSDWKLSGLPTTMILPEETKVKLQEADLAFQVSTGITEISSTCNDNHHYVMEADNTHYHCTDCNVRYVQQQNGNFSRCR